MAEVQKPTEQNQAFSETGVFFLMLQRDETEERRQPEQQHSGHQRPQEIAVAEADAVLSQNRRLQKGNAVTDQRQSASSTF